MIEVPCKVNWKGSDCMVVSIQYIDCVKQPLSLDKGQIIATYVTQMIFEANNAGLRGKKLMRIGKNRNYADNTIEVELIFEGRWERLKKWLFEPVFRRKF